MNKILIELTDRCNLQCNYCFEKKRNFFRRSEKSVLSSDCNLLEIAKNRDIQSVVLTGGEPLLYSSLVNIIECFSEKKITLLTNGLVKLNNPDLFSNIDVIVSLDGDYEIMKKNRGVTQKHFESIIKNIHWYQKFARNVTIETVITPFNIDSKNYFPYEEFGEDVNYHFTVPSMIFTPEILSIPIIDYEKVETLIKNYLNKYNYHIKCSMNLINNKILLESIDEIVSHLLIPEYNVPENTYFIFNYSFPSISKFDEIYEKKWVKMKDILCDYLQREKDSRLVDPFSIIEKAFYELGFGAGT